MSDDKGAATEDLEDLYENAPCGYMSVGADGRIFKANATLSGWMAVEPGSLHGRKLSDLLNIAGRIFYETHVAPLLRMQGFFNEFALDMVTETGERLPVIANAVERRDAEGGLLFTRFTIFKATDRRLYERELLKARAAAEQSKREVEELHAAAQAVLKTEREVSELREQFIAVLGHDLRNPLASLSAGARLMRNAKSPEAAAKLEDMMQKSVGRMARMIDDVMDFTRGRLGGGIALGAKSVTELEPVLTQVVAELSSDHPERTIETTFKLNTAVFCDAGRIAQMFSNLLQCADLRRPGSPGQGACRHLCQFLRVVHRQCRRENLRRGDGASVSTVLPGQHPPLQARPRARTVHRVRDREGT